jgi:hypothetical protein
MLKRLLAGAVLMAATTICSAQIIGLVPTPVGMYTWNPTAQQFQTVNLSSTSGALQNTPQAFAFYAFNATLNQWVACTSIAQCFGGANYEVNGFPLISSNPVNFVNGTGITVSNPLAGNVQFTNAGVTEIIPGSNVTCSTNISGFCVGNVTVNSTASGGGGGSANFQMIPPPVAGQYVDIYPTSCSVIHGDPGTGSSTCTFSSSGTTPGAGGTVGGTGTGGGLGNNQYSATWTGFALPSYVLPANITSVQGWSYNSLQTGPHNFYGIPCTQTGSPGFSLAAAVNGVSYGMQLVEVPTSLNNSNLGTVTCTAVNNYSTPGATLNANIASIGLRVFYTGTAPPANTAVSIAPCLYYNTAIGGGGGTLSFDPNCSVPALDIRPQSIPLPSAATLPAGTTFLVNNGTSGTDCSVGSGSSLVFCVGDGATGYTALTFTPTGNVANVQLVMPTTAIGAGTCTTPTTVTMTGVGVASGTTPGSTFKSAFETNPSAVVGWGSTGGLVLNLWASAASTLSWNVCNPTGASITPGAMKIDVGVNQ